MDMGGEGWGCREETDLPGKNNVCVLQSLETTTSFRCWGFVWIRVWGPYVGPCFVILKLCVCVFPHKMFPSYISQVNCELSKHFSSPLHIDYTLPDSFLNLVIPQVWLIFIFLKWRWHWEKKVQGLTSNIEHTNWEPWGLPSVTALNSWPALITQPCDPHSWSNVVPASVFMPGGNRSSRSSDHAHN